MFYAEFCIKSKISTTDLNDMNNHHAISYVFIFSTCSLMEVFKRTSGEYAIENDNLNKIKKVMPM